MTEPCSPSASSSSSPPPHPPPPRLAADQTTPPAAPARPLSRSASTSAGSAHAAYHNATPTSPRHSRIRSSSSAHPTTAHAVPGRTSSLYQNNVAPRPAVAVAPASGPPPQQAESHHRHHHHQQQQAASTEGGESASAADSQQQVPAPTFAAPSSFLRPPGSSRGGSAMAAPGVQQQRRHSGYGVPGSSHLGGVAGNVGNGAGRRASVGVGNSLDREQLEGLKAIRAFLKVRTSYDVLPLSFRLIVFDTVLLVKKSLNILIQNGIVSAPLWDSKTSTFAGLLTTSDYINVIQYYWQNPDAFAQIDQFRLNSLPDVERAIGVQPVETVSIHPDRPLYEACRKMVVSRARRIPLVDFDDETQRAMVVSVVTQYRILKFVAVNVKETQKLKKPLKDIRVGTYGEPGRGLAIASMDTPVMEVIHMLVKKAISSVPILDNEGAVINVFEAVDVITLIKGGVYDDLNLTVGDALLKRSDDFPGIYTCTLHDRLDTIFETIRKSRVHRMVVIDEHNRLKGVLTLSDILEYVLLEGEGEGEEAP